MEERICVRDTFVKYQPHKGRIPGIEIKKGAKVQVLGKKARMIKLSIQGPNGKTMFAWTPKKYFELIYN